MSGIQHLRRLINERLSAAATDIFGVVERKIAEYEEEVRCSKEENARLCKLLNAVLKPEIQLHRADSQKFKRRKQKIPSEQQHCEQERRPSLDQGDPDPPQIKEEVPPEQLHCEQERSPSLDQENPEPPLIKEEVPPEQLHCEQERSPSLDQENPEPPLIKEEVPPEQLHCEQERSSSLDQENPEPPLIKEEQEELWTSQDGEQLHDPMEDETETKDSMLTVVCVDSFFDMVQPARVDSSQSVDNREGVPVATTSTDPMTREPAGEDCGALQPDSSRTDSKDSERNSSADKLYNCHVCSRIFNAQSRFEHHMTSHAVAKPIGCSVRRKVDKTFKCSLCSKEFNRKDNLKYHMWHHRNERHYNCSLCGKGFYKKCHLTNHMRSHTGEKPFKCSVCSKAFSINSNLKTHMFIHTGEKPYSCDVCGSSFNRKNHATVHRRVHTREKPFK